MSLRSRGRAAAVAALLALHAAGAGAQDLRRGAIDAQLPALVQLSTPTGTRISPDGREVLFTLAALDSTGRTYRESIWRVSADGGTPVLVVANARSPRWSPDGSRIAYLSRVSRTTQLFVTAARGGETSPGSTQLTRLAGGVDDFAWSPDGRSIALVAAVRGEGADSAPRPQIHILRTSECNPVCSIRQITRARGTIVVHVWDPDANISWSPDGTRIAYSEKPTARFDDDYLSDISVVNVETGESTALVRRPGMDLRPVWSPDGRHIAFRSSFGSVDRFGDHGLSIVAATGGEPRDVGRSFEGGFLDGPYTYAWSADGRLLFLGAEPMSVGLFAIDVASGATTRLSGGRAKRALLSVAGRADAMAFTMADSLGPWELFASRATEYRPRRLTDYGAAVRGSHRATSVSWRNGEWQLDGVLLLPPDYRADRRYPVITAMHGGPEGQAQLAFSPELPSPIFEAVFRPHATMTFATAGYVVFVPNFRGSGGHGRAFRRAGLVDWTATFVSDVLSGLDTLIARGIADTTRLAVFGERSGASKVLNLLASTRRFRAGIVADPHADFVFEYNRLPDFQRQWENLFGGSPLEAPEQYRAHSPINNASRIVTPLQIVADETAFSTPTAQSVVLHERLASNGTPGELIVYRGRRLADDLALARRFLVWFDSWLR